MVDGEQIGVGVVRSPPFRAIVEVPDSEAVELLASTSGNGCHLLSQTVEAVLHRGIGGADLRFDFVFCRQQVSRSLGCHFCVIRLSLSDSVGHVLSCLVGVRDVASLAVKDLLSDCTGVCRHRVSGVGDVLRVLLDLGQLVVQLLLLLLVGCHCSVSSNLRGMRGVFRCLCAVAYVFDAAGKFAVGVGAFDRVVDVLVIVVHVVGRHRHDRGAPLASIAI